MKTIAVLLTCHNRKTFTINCLDALYKCQLPDDTAIQVFLVDDGSSDGTSTAVKEKFSSVNIILGNGDLYWNRGMHLAWQSAARDKDYDYYLWLNDDTVLEQNAVLELLDCSEILSNKAIVCGAVNSSKTGDFTYGGRRKDDSIVIPDGTIQPCLKINGNCVLVSKEVFEQIGLLDPIYPHAIGDFDYGLKAAKKGIKLITTRVYVAQCEKRDRLSKWCYGDVPLWDRLKALYSPLGRSHPIYFFIFEARHYGLHIAVLHFLSIHLRVFLPFLWK